MYRETRGKDRFYNHEKVRSKRLVRLNLYSIIMTMTAIDLKRVKVVCELGGY